MAPKREGPFTITEVLGPVTFKLELPKKWKIHPVFHAALLTPYHTTKEHGLDLPRPPPEVVEGEDKHEVEAIINHRIRGQQRKKTEYLVSWKGWEAFENSWEPESNLKNAPDILKVYKKKHHLKAVHSAATVHSSQTPNSTSCLTASPVPMPTQPTSTAANAPSCSALGKTRPTTECSSGMHIPTGDTLRTVTSTTNLQTGSQRPMKTTGKRGTLSHMSSIRTSTTSPQTGQDGSLTPYAANTLAHPAETFKRLRRMLAGKHPPTQPHSPPQPLTPCSSSLPSLPLLSSACKLLRALPLSSSSGRCPHTSTTAPSRSPRSARLTRLQPLVEATGPRQTRPRQR